MSAPVIGIIILAGLACLAGVFIVNSSVERARIKRHSKVAQYTENAHRFQRYLDYIPPHYIEKSLRLLILQEIINNLQRVHQMDSGNANNAARLEAAREDFENTRQSNTQPKVSAIKDAQEAADVRKRLMDLFKFVQYLQKAKKVDSATAAKHLMRLKNLFVEVGVTIHIMRAKQSLKDKNARLSLHYYNKAIAEYKKGNTQHQFDKQIAEIKAVAEEINNTLKAENEAKKAQPKEEPKRRVPKEDPRLKPKAGLKKIKEESTLSQELDAFIEDGDAWKKKSF